ncbi:MAG: LexA family transcriptional regulator [Deltaproteobacteria bacterium]|nr:LexA family transcriptional regulator [Deltaproteobacteria bacterium]
MTIFKEPEFRTRLEQLMNGESPFSWAARIGLSKGSFARVWKEGTIPSPNNLRLIADKTGVSIDWLLSGREPMMWKTAGTLDSAHDFTLVPRFSIRVGEGDSLSSDQIVDHLAFKKGWLKVIGLDEKELFLTTSRGDSMEPFIPDGALLLVDQRRKMPTDGVFLLLLEGELIPRRLQRDMDGGVWIRCDNDRYPPLKVEKDQLQCLRILGRVVWLGRKV